MPCLGNADDHCCYIKGTPCPFIIQNYEDETGHFRKWACSLRAKYGNWDDVLTDSKWQEVTKNAWRNGLNCRDWPDALDGPNKGVCKECGVNC